MESTPKAVRQPAREDGRRRGEKRQAGEPAPPRPAQGRILGKLCRLWGMFDVSAIGRIGERKIAGARGARRHTRRRRGEHLTRASGFPVQDCVTSPDLVPRNATRGGFL